MDLMKTLQRLRPNYEMYTIDASTLPLVYRKGTIKGEKIDRIIDFTRYFPEGTTKPYMIFVKKKKNSVIDVV